MEIKVQSVVYPKRKTKFVLQWMGYINAKRREINGFEKHKNQQL